MRSGWELIRNAYLNIKLNYVVEQIFAVLFIKFRAISALFNKILDEFLISIVTTIATIDKLLDIIIILFSIKIDGVFLDGR